MKKFSVSYYVEAERYWQFAGEGSEHWCRQRKAYVKAGNADLKIRIKEIK